MRRWIVIPFGLAVAGSVMSAVPGTAFAGDGDSQNTYAAAQASGGELTVQAGMTEWVPPASTSWAKTTQSDPPPGKPNPNQPYGCTYAAGGPSATASLGVGGPQPGQWVFPVCAGPGAIDPMPPIWVTGAQPVVASVQLSPVVVAEQAVRHLGFISPTIEMAPPTGSSQLVGVATWLWIDPGAWRTLSASATAGPVTTTAVATPTRVVWDMGDGSTVTCDGPGTPYDPSTPDASTDCSYTWPAPGSYQVTATVYWSVAWTAQGAPGGGTLGVQAGPASAVTVQVVESQAINTPAGGD
jgi:hypothetical protein